jgi:type VI secretion system secreted protein Hcp
MAAETNQQTKSTAMKSFLRITMLTAALLAARGFAQSQPNVAFFLEVDGIQGEDTEVAYEGQIRVESLNTAVKQRNILFAGQGGNAGKSDFLPVKIFKFVDKASPALFVACATGKPIAQAKIHGAYFGTVTGEFFTITLKDVVVASLNAETAEQAGQNKLLETVTLGYSQITWSYRPVLSTGQLGPPVTGGFDVKNNVKL